MSYQNITIVGNAGGNAEMRYLPDGTPVVNVSVAVNEHINDQDVTTWFRVAFWGERLTNAAMHIVKGQTLVVEGRVMVETWTDREGGHRAGLKINARTMRFVGGRPEGAAASPVGANGETPVDDIPF